FAPLSDAEFSLLATVRALEVFDDGNGEKLYAGGTFATIGDELIFGLGAWDGTTWSQLGGGLSRSPVEALMAFDGGRQPALYVGGEFGEVVGTTIQHLARWDGTAWTAVDGPGAGNINGHVFGLAAVGTGADARLVVGGDFATAGGIASSSFAAYRCRDVDWGDAPDPSYPTLAASDGARHVIVPGLHLGATIDGEDDGQPAADADRETSDDGVHWETILLSGELANFEVTASAPGRLDAWIDSDGDGNWTDNDDRLISNLELETGPNLVEALLPGSIPAGTPAMTRFRFSTEGVDSPTGLALDGEVEDYALPVERLAIGLTVDVTPGGVDEPGGEVSITVTVENQGTVSAVLDTLSDSTISGDVPGTCTLPSEIPVGQSYSCSYNAAISGNGGDIVQRTVGASATTVDTTARTSADVQLSTEIRDVLPSATTVVQLTPSTVDEPGAEVSVNITVTNTSTEPITVDVQPAFELPTDSGGCTLPQALAVNGQYQCQFTLQVG
ncbi:MAG: GEVED domain-containing protein, partial [Acidobacteriota bacterium]